MATIRGCELPDDLYYDIEKHVWARPMDDGSVRVGMTSVAGKLAGGKLAAITVKSKKIGQEIPRRKSVATVESSKYVGPAPAPVTGVLKRANDALAGDPNLAISDPYGQGWIAELEPADWDGEKAELASGPEGIDAYRQKLASEDIACD